MITASILRNELRPLVIEGLEDSKLSISLFSTNQAQLPAKPLVCKDAMACQVSSTKPVRMCSHYLSTVYPDRRESIRNKMAALHVQKVALPFHLLESRSQLVLMSHLSTACALGCGQAQRRSSPCRTAFRVNKEEECDAALLTWVTAHALLGVLPKALPAPYLQLQLLAGCALNHW